LNGRASPWITPVTARLRPGVSLEAAQAEMDVITTDLERLYPENRNRAALLVPFADQYFGHVRPALYILLGAVGFVLSIACTNLASLLLARGDARQRELAVRAALGAARARVARLVIIESLTVSILGGVLGVLCAVWFIDVLVALSPVSLPSFVRVVIDARVLAFTMAVCTLSGLLFGLAPALIGSRTDVIASLKLGGRDASSGRAPSVRRRLVTAEIAVALVLVTGAGLMLRTLDRLRAFDPGFRLDGLLTVTLSVPPDLLGNQAATRANEFLRTLLDRVRLAHGVDHASLTWDVPLIDIWLQTRVRIVDRDVDPVLVRRHMASPGYFATLGIPVLEGRDFTSADDRSASQYVAIISRRMAQRYWPDASALHQRLLYNERTLEIAGVVGDVQHESLVQPSADPDLYLSVYQTTLMRGITLAMRTSGESEPVVAAVRDALREVGQGATIFQTRTGEQIFNAQIARQRFMGALLTIFSSVALLLTLVGVYGVAAYNVSRQSREIGIRVALGATRSDVLHDVLRLELTPIVQGIVFGIAAGLAVTGGLSAFLHGVSPTDPLTFTVVALLLTAVAILACLIPARGATRIDPVVALRAE
jgi:predicted permease